MNYKRELKKLCKFLNQKLIIQKEQIYPDCNFPTGNFYPQLNKIYMSNWDGKDERGYFTGLHEIGHVVHGHWIREKDMSLMREKIEELQAWEWALSHAKIAITDPIVDMIEAALGSYNIDKRRINELLERYGRPLN